MDNKTEERRKAIEFVSIFFEKTGDAVNAAECAIIMLNEIIKSHQSWKTEQDEYEEYYNDIIAQVQILKSVYR